MLDDKKGNVSTGDANDQNGLRDQYLLWLELIDREGSKFWIRFNIFVGFQVALAIGMVSANGFVLLNPPVLRAFMIL